MIDRAAIAIFFMMLATYLMADLVVVVWDKLRHKGR